MRAVVWFLVIASILGAASAVLDAGDLAAFNSFYTALAGDYWHYVPSTTNPCTLNMDGRKVLCYKNRITEIYLRGNNLRGTISSTLGSLSALKELDLGNNPYLIGTLPPQLGNLTKVRDIIIDKAALTGTIPTTYVNMTSLLQLNLQYNQLDGEIPAFSSPILTTLLLAYNKICPIADYSQYAANNDYFGPTCGCATNPCTRGVCTGGTTVGAFTCDCSGTGYFGTTCSNSSPDETNFNSLMTATGGSNWVWKPQSGPICLGGERIQCDTNGYITHLELGKNGLTGTIPTTLVFSKLSVLDLSENSLYGTLPTELFSNTKLTYLSLSKNLFTGTLPTNLGSLTSLVQGIISYNMFAQTIPTYVGLLTSLSLWDSSNNYFSGTIPTQFGGITSLKTLRLNNNLHSGSIPSELAIPSLVELSVQSNRLTGNIPSSFDPLTTMLILRAKNNQLSGALSSALVDNGFQYLELSGNSLTGDYSTWGSAFTDY